MNVVFLSPGFPAEMPHFTQALAQVGVRVFGVGDAPVQSLPDEARQALTDYLQVKDLWDEEATVQAIAKWMGARSVDRVECLWEPGVVLTAKLRQAFELPGLSIEQSVAFRDKEIMKQVLDDAGVRTPRHARATSEPELREAAERIGFPLIIKPIAGAGSADTYPVHSSEELDEAVQLTRHVPEVSVEEFIEGEELTFDTICAGGDVLFHNVSWYRPKPLVSRLNPWISSQAICLRDTGVHDVQKGRDLGHAVLRALGFQSGFTHMEWFLTPDGEAVFGEIGARAPGARLVHAMNYSCDGDLFVAWAEAVCYGRVSQDLSKKYNAALVFKRAEGEGKIKAYEGLDSILAQHGEHIVHIDLTPIGQPKRDWRKVVVGDGWIVARHPNLEVVSEIANELCANFRITTA